MRENTSLYKPHALQKGDEIGLVSPVGEMNKQYERSALTKTLLYLKSRGYRIGDAEINKTTLIEGVQDPQILLDYYDPYVFDGREVCLNPFRMMRRSFLGKNNSSSEERVDLFNQAVAQCRAVLPLVGNRFGLDIVDQVDYVAFQRNKPIFVTFSAASAFLLHLHLNTNVEVFYGPHVHFLAGRYENNYTESSFWEMLTKKKTPFLLENIYSSENNIIGKEIPFIGHHNQSSSSVTGTLLPIFLFSLEKVIKQESIDFDPRGKILILEADERSYEECLEALQLIHERVNLSNLSALVLASFIAFKQESIELRNSLLDRNKIAEFVSNVRALLDDNIPVIYGFPMGHSKHKLTIPMGIKAELDIETGDITIIESLFS
ncbi:MAG: LD-carboxypeptidase [Pseudomonadales bacterium]|nr:LD-carboxypeptidase [Pseudomonadales bacterium]